MLQELKGIDFVLDSNLNFIWKDAFKVLSNHSKGKGGVSLLIIPKWSPYITGKGVSPCNMVVWVTMNINSLSFGIFSIYASSDYKERENFWSWLTSLPNILWFVGRDFNMIESEKDKVDGLPFAWKDGEKIHRNRMKQCLYLCDPLLDKSDNKKDMWHTWCNFQQGPF